MDERHESATWSLRLPKGWTTEQDEDCTTMHADPPVGALQISAYEKDGEVTEADLVELAGDDAPEREPVACGAFVGFVGTTRSDGEFWRQWYLRAGSTVLFATYVCTDDLEGIEDELVDAALDTLEPE